MNYSAILDNIFYNLCRTDFIINIFSNIRKPMLRESSTAKNLVQDFWLYILGLAYQTLFCYFMVLRI